MAGFVNFVLAKLFKSLKSLLVFVFEILEFTNGILVLQTQVEQLLGDSLKLVGNELGLSRTCDRVLTKSLRATCFQLAGHSFQNLQVLTRLVLRFSDRLELGL